jgi:hypothetical protein
MKKNDENIIQSHIFLTFIIEIIEIRMIKRKDGKLKRSWKYTNNVNKYLLLLIIFGFVFSFFFFFILNNNNNSIILYNKT